MLARGFFRMEFFTAGPGKLRAGEDAVEGVVVGLSDRVVFVIVAAGATERQAEEGAAGGVDGVFERQVPQFIRGGGIAPGQCQVAGGDDLFVTTGIVGRWVGGEDVAGELFADELIERLVVLEGVEHVVAVEAGFGDGIIGVVAGRVGVAHDVEPVASPAFAVVGRGEQAFDEAGPGVGRGVGQIFVDFGGRRGQAEKVEVGAAQEHCRWGAIDGGELLVAKARTDEAIDGRESRIDVRGGLDGGEGLEGPMTGGGKRIGGGIAWRGPGGAVVDPAGDVVDGVGGQFFVGGHGDFVVSATDGLDEQAVVGLAWNESRPVVAAGQEGRARVNAQTTARLLAAVALGAGVRQQRGGR